MKYVTHPLTVLNLLIVGTVGMIQVIHTRAHHKMEIDVHSYCRNNAEWVESQTQDDY